ncbi:MAG: 3-dehydroquinate synthase [Actinobacteria bacterium]|uniref:3-dehydroquinate synthase n=1 Tax=freshwater metagenome TaxID=449393 RepID=A0A6J6HPN9_9ZZZZ|nr:3-dehydroquinate synthase [Actinomycetota bacterium]MTA21072.1 3-dehydroquinate synthase [Actinomycetota bacterium]
MTREISITADRKYSVFIDTNWLSNLQELSKDRQKIGVVVSSNMREQLSAIDLSSGKLDIFEIPDGEAGKSSDVLFALWNKLNLSGFTRGDLLVGVGGGAVTDLTGFLAATWLRGVDWVAVPTTLAGMVDAAVGGKTGINTELGKNLVGAFHSPISVLVDLNWLETLSNRDFAAGLAEVIKCGFIADEEILRSIDGMGIDEIRAKRELVQSLIERAVAVKAHVVSEDFKEGSLREILNYGHTFGHAIETHSQYALRHGEAVSIGMVFVAEIAYARGLISGELFNRHRQILSQVGLPTLLPDSFTLSDLPTLTASMQRDKKVKGGKVRFVVLHEGNQLARLDDVNSSEITLAYEKILS